MSRVLQIIVEGQTERDFVKECMTPYFNDQGIYNIRTIGIETSPGHKGGDIRYARFRPNVVGLLHGQEDMIVTSFIDFYRLEKDFPAYEEAQKIEDPIQKVTFLEESCGQDINDGRFIPYIQLHEFEGLLFTNTKGFSELEISRQSQRGIEQIVNRYANPELINEGSETAPSKRIKRLIPNYEKPFHGVYIAHGNGFQEILDKCPRFNAWIDLLIQEMKKP